MTDSAPSAGEREQGRRRLIRQLQMAYSAELAAGHAYAGHARSVRDPATRASLSRIEDDEWRHRDGVGRMLRELGGRPSRLREGLFWTIGRGLGIACHLSGWYLPMYGAGRLERNNVQEYVDAARSAIAAGRADLVEALLEMAETEWDHERFFRAEVTAHRWTRWFGLWPPLPARDSIRSGFTAIAPSGLPGPFRATL